MTLMYAGGPLTKPEPTSSLSTAYAYMLARSLARTSKSDIIESHKVITGVFKREHKRLYESPHINNRFHLMINIINGMSITSLERKVSFESFSIKVYLAIVKMSHGCVYQM